MKPQQVCACGSPLAHCQFWSPVLSRWGAFSDEADPALQTGLASGYERMRGLPRLVWDSLFRRQRVAQYATLTQDLFAAILAESGRRLLVDSSKSPARAIALTRIPGLRLAFIHMVRDPRGVVWSRIKAWRQRAGSPPSRWRDGLLGFRAAIDWVLVNLVGAAVTRLAGGGLRIRYEDLAASPEEAMRPIGRMVGLDLTEVARMAARGAPIDYQHLVAGNPRRLAGPAPLQADLEWTRAMPRWVQSLVWWITTPLAKVYGYRR